MNNQPKDPKNFNSTADKSKTDQSRSGSYQPDQNRNQNQNQKSTGSQRNINPDNKRV